MSRFGWSYPPGVSRTPWDDPCICAVCGHVDDGCVCPECPVCHTCGDPKCYLDTDEGKEYARRLAIKKDEEKHHHGMKLNQKQLIARQEIRIAKLQEQLVDEGQYLDWLKEQEKNNATCDDHK